MRLYRDYYAGGVCTCIVFSVCPPELVSCVLLKPNDAQAVWTVRQTAQKWGRMCAEGGV